PRAVSGSPDRGRAWLSEFLGLGVVHDLDNRRLAAFVHRKAEPRHQWRSDGRTGARTPRSAWRIRGGNLAAGHAALSRSRIEPLERADPPARPQAGLRPLRSR